MVALGSERRSDSGEWLIDWSLVSITHLVNSFRIELSFVFFSSSHGAAGLLMRTMIICEDCISSSVRNLAFILFASFAHIIYLLADAIWPISVSEACCLLFLMTRYELEIPFFTSL